MDVPTARDGRKVIDLLQQPVGGHPLQYSEVEGGAPDTAARQAYACKGMLASPLVNVFALFWNFETFHIERMRDTRSCHVLLRPMQIAPLHNQSDLLLQQPLAGRIPNTGSHGLLQVRISSEILNLNFVPLPGLSLVVAPPSGQLR